MSVADRRRLEQALRLLGEDPAKADAMARADALWLMRVLPAASAPDNDVAREGDGDGSRDRSQRRTSSTPATASTKTSGAADWQAGGSTNPGSDKTSLFVQQGSADEARLHARRVSVPAADALPGRSAFERALRPFLRRRPSRTQRMVDAQATAEASAQASADALLATTDGKALPALVPVLRAVPERWFDLILLAEQDDTMRVFEDTLRELRHLLARHGAFRRVGLWRWSARDDAVHVHTTGGTSCAPYSMLQGQHPQLVWVLTHGASTRWNDAPLRAFLRGLAQRAVVAIVQLMPESAWSATPLGSSGERVRSRERAALNSQLLRRAPWTGTWTREDALDAVPMLSLRGDMVARWAEFVMAPRALEHPAIDIAQRPAPRRRKDAAGPTAVDPHAAIRDQLLRFRAVASPQGFALLRLLSGAWITLPVMRLLLQSVSGPRSLAPMAEVLLSGMLRRAPDSGERLEDLSFDFQPGVREWLSGSLSSEERQTLDQAMAESREAIRRFVESRLRRTISTFSALLLDPAGTDWLPASAKSFVDITRRLHALRRPGPAVATAEAAPKQPAAVPKPPPVRSAVRPVRVLHLSNLYFGRDKPVARWRERPGMSKAWLQKLHDIVAKRAVDLVCLSGDVAMAGSDEQYAEATAFVSELLHALGLPRERFFCVPGNHDIDRHVRPHALETLPTSKSPAIDEAELATQMLQRQAAFRRWQAANMAPARRGRGLGYRVRVDLGDGDALNVIGLDSAWLAELDDRGTLRLGHAQLNQLVADEADRLPAIALMHHPLHALIDGEEVEKRLVDFNVAVLLNGHLRPSRNSEWGRTADGLVVSTSGSMYGDPEFQLLDFNLHPGVDGQPDRLFAVSIETEYWSTTQERWLSSAFDDPREDDRKADPGHSDHSTREESLFLGREVELETMRRFLLPKKAGGKRVVLIGRPGIGKTSLVREFHRRYWQPAMSTTLPFDPGQELLTVNVMALRGERDVESLLVRMIANALGFDRSDASWETVQAELQARPRLLVFDDVEAGPLQELIQEAAERLRDCTIIATCRERTWHGRRWPLIELGRMPPTDMVKLAISLAAEFTPRRLDNDTAKALVRIADGLLGALRMAVTLWHEGTTIDAIAAEVTHWIDNRQAQHADLDVASGGALGRPTAPAASPAREGSSTLRNVFISTTGTALDAYHRELRNVLVERGIGARSWEDIRISGSSSLQRVDDFIRASDALVCLTVPGGRESDPPDAAASALLAQYPDLVHRLPRGRTAPPIPKWSYQQWEANLALYHRKRLFVSMISPVDAAPPSATTASANTKRQREHLQRLQGQAHVEHIEHTEPEAWLASSWIMEALTPPIAETRQAASARRSTVFVSYAAEDAAEARRLIGLLREYGYDPQHSQAEDIDSDATWLTDVAPWINAAEIMLVCVSTRSEEASGRRHEEIELAIESAATAVGPAALVPVRLDRCKVPASLADHKRLDFFAAKGADALLGFVADTEQRLAADRERDDLADTQDDSRPSVFLSYAREDVVAVRKLAGQLKEIGLAPVFFDVAVGISAADPLTAITSALESCDYCMVLLSKAADSRQGKFRDEWRTAIALAGKFSRPYLLPVVIDRRQPKTSNYREIFKGDTAVFSQVPLLHAPSGVLNEQAISELSRLAIKPG